MRPRIARGKDVLISSLRSGLNPLIMGREAALAPQAVYTGILDETTVEGRVELNDYFRTVEVLFQM